MNIDLMKKLCSMKKEQLHSTLIKYLSNKYKNIIVNQKFVAVRGNIPICLIAHMDTVFTFPPQRIYYDKDYNVLWSPDGLGTDDRAGIYAIINIIESGLRPHVIITDEEETGGIGAEELIKTYNTCPFECKFIMELDRQGKDDAVFYECNNKKFEKVITSYGFTTQFGTFTDISIIAPFWKIAAVNLSVGYYMEHSLSEYINMNECHETIEKVKQILLDHEKLEKFKYIPLKHRRRRNNFINLTEVPCVCCGKRTPITKATNIGEEGFENSLWLCEECYNQYINNFLC